MPRNDESSEDDNIIKTGRPNKAQLYKEQRNDVLMRLFNILNVEPDNNAFFNLDDMNDDIQNEILELADDVKRYFIYSNWPYFKKGIENKTYLSLMKSILKDMGYSMKKCHNYVTKKGIKEKQTKICIDKIKK